SISCRDRVGPSPRVSSHGITRFFSSHRTFTRRISCGPLTESVVLPPWHRSDHHLILATLPLVRTRVITRHPHYSMGACISLPTMAVQDSNSGRRTAACSAPCVLLISIQAWGGLPPAP